MKDCSCFGPNKFNLNKHKQTNKSTLPSYSRHDALGASKRLIKMS